MIVKKNIFKKNLSLAMFVMTFIDPCSIHNFLRYIIRYSLSSYTHTMLHGYSSYPWLIFLHPPWVCWCQEYILCGTFYNVCGTKPEPKARVYHRHGFVISFFFLSKCFFFFTPVYYTTFLNTFVRKHLNEIHSSNKYIFINSIIKSKWEKNNYFSNC